MISDWNLCRGKSDKGRTRWNFVMRRDMYSWLPCIKTSRYHNLVSVELEFCCERSVGRTMEFAIGDAGHGDGTSEPDKQIRNGLNFFFFLDEITRWLLFTPTFAISFTVVTFQSVERFKILHEIFVSLCFSYLIYRGGDL